MQKFVAELASIAPAVPAGFTAYPGGWIGLGPNAVIFSQARSECIALGGLLYAEPSTDHFDNVGKPAMVAIDTRKLTSYLISEFITSKKYYKGCN